MTSACLMYSKELIKKCMRIKAVLKTVDKIKMYGFKSNEHHFGGCFSLLSLSNMISCIHFYTRDSHSLRFQRGYRHSRLLPIFDDIRYACLSKAHSALRRDNLTLNHTQSFCTNNATPADRPLLPVSALYIRERMFFWRNCLCNPTNLQLSKNLH